MLKLDPDACKSIYLIAICGTGMTALAGLLKARGFVVSGSDLDVYPPMSTFLNELEIPVHLGFAAEHLDPEPDLVIVGNAVSRGNPEVEEVLNRKLHYVSLPCVLREFFIRGQYSCVVAGTHGKTTTSSLLAWTLEAAGRDPGFFIGGIPENFGRGFKLGKGKYFVCEGDEYDSAFFDKRSKFLHYLPDLVILNNIEFDHADIFNSYDDVETAFVRLLKVIPANGYLFACWDDENVKRVSDTARSRVISFGLQPDADWQARNIRYGSEETHFEVHHKDRFVAAFTTPLSGEHMVRNCLAVAAAASTLGVPAESIAKAMASFKNVRRRLQLKGERRGIRVFDDFAHHPTEIAATIDSVRKKYPEARVWAVFEPRTATSKRKVIEKQLVKSLSTADEVILTPLYREDKVPAAERLQPESVQAGLTAMGVANHLLSADQNMVEFLLRELRDNDVVLFMSNGDFHQIPDKLLAEL